MERLQFIYRWGCAPAEKELAAATNAAASRVHEKLTRSGIHGPRMDEHYRKSYYEPAMRTLTSKLQNCAHHVMGALAHSRSAPSRLCFIDHGGGLGLIGLLAKELGVGRVVYNDIDLKFLEAAQGIARAAGAESDQYIAGDIESLVTALGDDVVDALASYDVLEHIYDLDVFLARLCGAPCRPKTLFMSSGANMFSPRYLRSVFPIQRKLERSYRSRRAAIIRDRAPHLTELQVALLAKATRKLVRREVEAVVDGYLRNGQVAVPRKTGANRYDPYGTNTVDPDSGWWAEHLLNPWHLTRHLMRHGYTARIRAGYFGRKGAFLNPVISAVGAPLALPVAAFYTVQASLSASSR